VGVAEKALHSGKFFRKRLGRVAPAFGKQVDSVTQPLGRDPGIV